MPGAQHAAPGLAYGSLVNPGSGTVVRGVRLAALASMLALGLAACERRPAANESGQPLAISDAVEARADATGSARKPVDDKTLATRVRAALMASPALNATTIDVAATRGVVTLFGTTNTTTRRDLAGYLALRVEGVNTVRNRIVVISSS